MVFNILDLFGGGDYEKEHINLMSHLSRLKGGAKSNEDLLEEIKKLKEELQKVKDERDEAKEKVVRSRKSMEAIDLMNLNKSKKSPLYRDELLIHPDIYNYAYNEDETGFDKINAGKVKNASITKDKQGNVISRKENVIGFRDYQKRFIEDWSVSTQECVILYYGVGSGKTLIAVNCAEQFVELNKNHHVYFLTPASLVLGTIEAMYKSGIDPTRQYADGTYVYYFVSYQQMIRSNFKFHENSLLILDEAHNLRNFFTKGINEKVSARKWVDSGDYSLMGNVLARRIIESENKFLRSIFMTGTLFVNNSGDLEAIMSLGYKKRPLLNYDAEEWKAIQRSENEFKLYYEGLLSFYRIPDDAPQFASKNYHFELIEGEGEENPDEEGKDSYFIHSRNEYNNLKNKWVIEFLKKHKGERTLIYSQFLERSLSPLLETLDKMKMSYGVISGKESQAKKKKVENAYNEGQIDVLFFTLAIKEGVSFKESDNIIMMQPYWNYAITEQILARGIRLDSHKKGKDKTIQLYMLVGINPDMVGVENYKKVKQWKKDAEKIMNDGIKKLKYPNEKRPNPDFPEEFIEQKAIKTLFYGSRDIDMYNRMFNKQEAINEYEKRILELPRFEEVNNNENNDFVKTFNAMILDMEQTAPISNKQKAELKKSMYLDFYKKEIENVNKRVIRFEDDIHYKQNRNPDLETIVQNRPQEDVEKKVKEMVDKGASLDKILTLFDIGKTEITTFQANFTPEDEIEDLLHKSKLWEDTRKNLKVLEPTAGIGNIVGGILKLKNANNLMIDANEYHNVFYQIGKATYSAIDNVKFYNVDFLKFQNKYNYDYIIGNPPFNLRHQEEVKTEGNKRKGIPQVYGKRDKVFYDVDFVAKSYNLLTDGGKLAMIISTRHKRQPDMQPFKKFNQYLELLGTDYYEIHESGNFKSDKGVTKEMETNFGMEIIIIKKKPNHLMELDGQQLLTDLEIKQGVKATKKKGEDIIGNEDEALQQEYYQLLGDVALEKTLLKPKKPKAKTLKEVKAEAKALGIQLTHVVDGKKKPKNKSLLEKQILNPPKNEVIPQKVKVKTLKELKAEAKAKNIILTKTVNGKKVQKTKADLQLELSKQEEEKNVNIMKPKGIVEKAVQKIEKKIEKVAPKPAPTPAPKKETKAQTKKRLESEKITKKLEEEGQKVAKELETYVKYLTDDNQKKYLKLADKAKELGIPLTTFNNKNKIVYKTIADLEQDLKDNNFLLEDKPVKVLTNKEIEDDKNERIAKEQERIAKEKERMKKNNKPVEAPKEAPKVEVPKKEEKKLDDTQGKLLRDKLIKDGELLSNQMEIFKKVAKETNDYANQLNAEMKKTKQKTGRSETMKFNKLKKQADEEKGKIYSFQDSIKSLLEKIYPYTKYDDYEEVKKKGEPIRKRIREINSELSSINFSQNITTFSSDNKKSYAEQLADEKVRKAKDKEANKVKTEPLEKELNTLENNPDYEKLLKYELTGYNPDFKKFVEEITIRLNDGKPIDDLIKTKPQLVGSGKISNFLKSLNKDEKEKIKNVVQSIVGGKGKNKKNINDGYALHAVIINKSVPLEKAKKDARNIMKSKTDKFMRQTENSYRFRNIPKQKFSDFRSQVVNPEITLIWGKMK